MSDFNQTHNRVVWCDVPVADLDRASAFYSKVLDIDISTQEYQGERFCVLAHQDGNGGCLIVAPDEVASDAGIRVYFNVEGRIRDATRQVEALGGSIVEPIHAIGPHGFRAIVRDSEGNRIILHSMTDD